MCASQSVRASMGTREVCTKVTQQYSYVQGCSMHVQARGSVYVRALARCAKNAGRTLANRCAVRTVVTRSTL